MSNKTVFYWVKYWIQHPAYFLLCFALGLCVWSLSFEFKKSIDEPLNFSLQNKAISEIQFNEEKAISRFPASVTKATNKKLPQRFRSNPAFQLIEKMKHVVE